MLSRAGPGTVIEETAPGPDPLDLADLLELPELPELPEFFCFLDFLRVTRAAARNSAPGGHTGAAFPAPRRIVMAPHPSTLLETHTPPAPTTEPHVIVRGEGLTAWDSEGRSYLDATSGMLCTNLGYSQPRLVRAAARQMAELPFFASFAHRTTDVTPALAEDLARLSPIPMGRTFFANSGAEANDSAFKLAWYYHQCLGRHGRFKILSQERGYHGTTVAAGSATGLDFVHRGFGLPLPSYIQVPCPDPHSALRQGLSEDDFVDRLVGHLKRLITAEGPDSTAAFIAEPILGAGGVIIPPSRYYPRVGTAGHEHHRGRVENHRRPAPGRSSEDARRPPTARTALPPASALRSRARSPICDHDA
ncbi:aminotransferase class III-fold pyridoxal phosphate-dependent enzyme [Streptomyces sp. NPDC001185]|uniref:aminotransferase class III-fold pyridoxal phosphate-dependent enzyme n=1 Tax=Streptomyces sp. NPDC001185 TaxID=3154380 RepID=UPI00331A6401